MGVKNLWDILESCKKTQPLHHLQNKRVCIDLSCWMVQLLTAYKSHSAIEGKVYLQGLFHRLRALLALNCNLIFVTDGSIPAIKQAAYRRRLNSGHEDRTNSEVTRSLRRNMDSEFSCVIKEAKVLGSALGIPCLDGIEEAEAQCALLNSESLCDGCFTSDSDAFLFGARTIYRDICLKEGGHVVCYEMVDIERELGFGRNSLIALALLLGSDYSDRVHGLGPETACKIVKSVGDNHVLHHVASGVWFTKKSESSNKQKQMGKCNDKNSTSLDTRNKAHGRHRHPQSQDEFLRVISAYLNPVCHAADSEEVHNVLVQHPFRQLKLQQICSQLFGWPADRTDELILAKIAERDLRRFANLRSTAKLLGTEPSLAEIPVRCPVSTIVKRRKVQAKECFEVQWEGFDGLGTTVVPADLVHRACPEKITEYEEREAAAKKRNHNKPKLNRTTGGNGSSVTSIEALNIKLQNLLIDVEEKIRSVRNLSPLSPCDRDDRRPAAVPQVSYEKEIIDLSSPSPPPLNSRNTPDRVSLSDSEIEFSQDHHNRKSREIRLFIASIKDELY